MTIPRVIPVLLLSQRAIYNTKKFKNPKYIGDPINIIKLFNDKEVDEIILLDFLASKSQSEIDFPYLKSLFTEAFMPLAYGGGVSTLKDIEKLLHLGVEKVVLNSAVSTNPNLIEDAAREFGSQSIVYSLDVRKRLLRGYYPVSKSGTVRSTLSLKQLVNQLEDKGAGEIIVNNISREGTQKGFDINLILAIKDMTNLPIVPLGGAGSLDDLLQVLNIESINAVAASSVFVYDGPHNAVLVSYSGYEKLVKDE